MTMNSSREFHAAGYAVQAPPPQHTRKQAAPVGAGVLRGGPAGEVRAARFSADLRMRTELPQERLAEADAVGYAAGWAQGRQQAAELAAREAAELAELTARREAERAAEAERSLTAVLVAADRLEQRTLPLLADLEDEVMRAAVTIAEALLGRELRLSPEPAMDALRRALVQVPEGRPVTVRLNPADLAALTPQTGDGTPDEVDGRPVVLVADPGLNPGEAVADSGALTVDARLSTAVARVKELLDQ